jgi:lysophospholipase L1-like esterase
MNRIVPGLIVSVGLLFAAGCSTENSMSRVDRPAGPYRKMVVLGESTVQGGGWLRSNDERYADILHKLLEEAQEQPIEYINAGIGGSVIAPTSVGYEHSMKPSAAERLDDAVLAHNPDLVIIAYGLNDMRSGMPVERFRAELASILDRVDARLKAQVVLVSVYYMHTFNNFPPFDVGSTQITLAYNDAIRELAEQRNMVYADVYSAEAPAKHVVHQDSVHANKLGNMLIAHEIFKQIIKQSPGMAKNMWARDAKTKWTTEDIVRINGGREPSENSVPGR